MSSEALASDPRSGEGRVTLSPLSLALSYPSGVPVSVADILSLQGLVLVTCVSASTHIWLWAQRPWNQPVAPFPSCVSRVGLEVTQG